MWPLHLLSELVIPGVGTAPELGPPLGDGDGEINVEHLRAEKGRWVGRSHDGACSHSCLLLGPYHSYEHYQPKVWAEARREVDAGNCFK